MDSEKDMEKLDPSISLIDSFEAEIQRIGGDFSEVGLDLLIEDDLLCSIPIVSTLANMYRGYRSIRDRLFMRKVFSCLYEFSDVTKEKRAAFTAKLSADAGTREKAGAALILLLDRLDDLEKPAIVGRLLRAYDENLLSYDDLRRFCMVVDRAFLPDLIELSKSQSVEGLNRESGEHLHSLGLLAISGEDANGWPDGSPGSKITYALNGLGDKFLSAAFPSDSG